MKNYKQILGGAALVLVFLTVFNTSIFAQKNDPVVSYNNEVLYHYTLLDNQIALFDKAIWNSDITVEELDKQFDLARNICKYNFPVLKAIKPIKEDKWFYKSVVSFYGIVEDALDNEFADIMDYYSQDWDDSFAEKITELEKKAVDKIVKAEEEVIDAQKKFADANDLNLN